MALTRGGLGSAVTGSVRAAGVTAAGVHSTMLAQAGGAPGTPHGASELPGQPCLAGDCDPWLSCPGSAMTVAVVADTVAILAMLR